MQLKWLHQFQFAGYYAALHQGFYQEEGFDVTIKPGGPKVAIDDEVLSGRADFGVLASELVAGRISGKPLVLLAVIMQHSTRAIIVRAESNINSPADLIDKKLMLNLNEDAEFRAMFAAEGISFEKLTVIAKDKTANSKFIEGTIDGLNGSIGNQPFLFAHNGIPVKTIRPISYGIDFYGDSLFTSEQFLKDHPAYVERFRRATLKGWTYAMGNVEEIIDLIIEDYDPNASKEHLLFEAKALRKLILPDLVDIGHISPQRIERIAHHYAQIDQESHNYSVEGFIYNPNKGTVNIRKLVITFVSILIVALTSGAILLFFNSRLKRRVAEQTEELRDSHTLLTSIVEGTNDAIFLKNLKGHYLLANSATLKALGKTEHEVIGKKDDELFPEKSAMVIAEADTKVMLSGQPQIAEEQLETSYGVSYWLASKAPYKDSDGNVIGLIGISREISDLKQIENEKKELQEQLNHSQKMESIGTLAGGIAHDFNNILGAILGYAELVQDDTPKGSRTRDDIDQIIIASNRAKELVKQILTFSRQSGVGVVALQPAIIIKEISDMICSSLPTTINVQQDIDAKTGAILADPTQIHQLLANLITNAFHAMEENGGTLTISLKSKEINENDIINDPNVTPGFYIEISVGDTGNGIAPNVKEKIFDPYFTTKEVGKGTGMGLSIVHGIVKSYSGFIAIDSALGKGTTFRVFLPITDNESITEDPIDEQVPVGNERILLVDDEVLLAKMGENMLESLGYHVTAKTNSFEALKVFRNHPDMFDIVITDQTMPGMTGSDLSKKILHIRPDIPIILNTGYSSVFSEENAKSIGITEYVFKPVAKKDMAQIIRKSLDSSPPITRTTSVTI